MSRVWLDAERPDAIDKMVYSETLRIRFLYHQARARLGLRSAENKLTPVTIMQRGVPDAD